MQIPEFVEKFVDRWNVRSEKAFAEDAKEFLKRYEGETLDYALNNLIMDWQKKFGAPAIADIIEICRKVQADNATTVSRKPETTRTHASFAEQSMSSPLGRDACDGLYGQEFYDFCEEHGRLPNGAEVQKMRVSQEKFMAECKRLSDLPVRSDLLNSLLSQGRTMHKKDLEWKRKYGRAAA